MNSAGDASTRDPRQLYITLRNDLHISVQYYHGKPCYLLEDPQEIQFYRVGIDEGTFISMLDGKTSLDEVLRQSATSLGKDAFSEQEAMQIVHWLLDTKLAYPSGQISLEQQKDESAASRRHDFNPLAIRMPSAHPDRFFTAALAVVCMVVRIGCLGSLALRMPGRGLAVDLWLECFYKRVADR